MKNICIITPCSLPIPTVKGGAVETLVEYILDENEKQSKLHCTVFSIYDEKAVELSKKYCNTDFVYIKPRNALLHKLVYQFYRVLKHFNIYIPFSLEFKEVLKKLKKMPPQDAYIYEAGPTTQLPLLSKVVPKEKLYAHLHWDGLANEKKDKNCGHIIPVSRYIGNRWIMGAKCADEKIIPLKNCAKVERFTKKSTDNEIASLKNKLGIDKNDSVIVFTGRIVEEKGVRELLKAYELLEHKNTALVIIGSANFGMNTNTPYEQEIQQMISQSKRKIIFTGYVHQTELYKYYNIADFAVMPSLFQDPAPLVCIETQAAGVAMIATKVGGLPEYLGDDCAKLVEVNDDLVSNLAKTMDNLIDNPDKRRQMGQNAENNAKKYTTESYYNNFCDIIYNN